MQSPFLNREHAIIGNRLLKRTKRARRNGAASADHIAHLPIGNNAEFANVDAGSAMDAATDVANLWLRDAFGSELNNETAFKPFDIARQFGRHFSIRQGHNDIWTRALWENWEISVGNDNEFRFVPDDWDFARRMDAWVTRHEANCLEFARIRRPRVATNVQRGASGKAASPIRH